jgi:uncharacterized protein
VKVHLRELERGPHELEIELTREEVSDLLDDVEEGYELAEDTLELEIRVERMAESVRVRSDIEARFRYECGRCLRERTYGIDDELEFFLMPREEFEDTYDVGEEEEIELEAEDMDVSFFSGEVIDLEPLFREAMLLELPTLALCPPEDREGCDEALQELGGGIIEDLRVEPEEEAEPEVDDRWSALREIELDSEEE